MFFEEEYRKIIEQLKKNEDYAVMRTICENIVEVLKENGVKVDGTIVKNVTRTKTLAVVDDFDVRFNGLDFTEHDKRYVEEINDLKNQISELENELSVKEDLLKIKNAYTDKDRGKDLKAMVDFEIHIDEETLKKFAEFGKEGKILEEPLPFSDEQYEEDLIKELEDRHQQDFITINQLHTTIDTLVDRYAKLRRDL